MAVDPYPAAGAARDSRVDRALPIICTDPAPRNNPAADCRPTAAPMVAVAR
jgi:hypothetical protein